MYKKSKKKDSNNKYQIVELSLNEADMIVATGFHNSNIDYKKESYSSRVKETRAILSKLHMN